MRELVAVPKKTSLVTIMLKFVAVRPADKVEPHLFLIVRSHSHTSNTSRVKG